MKEIALQAIHEGHSGIKKCKQRKLSCVDWPVMNDIEQLVKQSEICNKFVTSNCKEPIILHEVSWKKLALIISHF